MADRVQQLLPELKKLNRLKPAHRKKFIKCCSSSFISHLCEALRNLLKGNVPISHGHLKSLNRHKQLLRKLTLKRTSLTNRKQILQRGGFLGFLLKPLIAGLASLIGGFIGNRNAEH